MTVNEYDKATRALEFKKEEARNAAWLKYSKSRDKIDKAHDKAMAKLWDSLWVDKRKFVRNESLPLPPF